MNFQVGHIHLFDIYSFVADHPRFPSDKDCDSAMREYGKLITRIVEPIPAHAGWYNWGCMNQVGYWESRYVGKSHTGKTSSLKVRIKEELKDERALFWATVYGTEPTARQYKKLFEERYVPATRAYRKCGTHFIIWVGSEKLSEEEVMWRKRCSSRCIAPPITFGEAFHIRRTRDIPKQYLTGSTMRLRKSISHEAPERLYREARLPALRLGDVDGAISQLG